MKITARLLPLLALPAVLAACGTASTGTGSIKFDQLKTEYKDAAGNYVACDNVSGGTGNPKQTAVGVYYTVSGDFNSIDIGLRGATSSAYDNNYKVNIPKSSLQATDSNSYKTVFFADSSSGLLPQAIVVNPNPDVAVKTVTTSGKVGSFYASLRINGNGTSAETDSLLVAPKVNVYTNCTVTGTTAEKL